MKLLKCEVCGSNEMTKNGDLFVCDYCGAKYTIDAARKMIESTVNISGNVSIDSSSRLKSFIQAAFDAYEHINLDNVLKYAEEALNIDPTNADALWAMVGYSMSRDGYRVEEYCNRAHKHSANSLGIIT